MRRSTASLLTLSFGLLAGGSAHAQSGSSWTAWFGCWDLVARSGLAAESAPRVCVLPTGQAATVELLSVMGDSVLSRQRLDASGPREVRQDDCSGTEKVNATQARIYLRTTLRCGSVDRLVNSVMSITPGGEWLDVKGVAFGTSVGVRALRYRPTSPSTRLPAEVSAALRGGLRGVSEARIAVSGPLQLSDVVEASRHLEVGVLQTWLAEQGQGFQLDARSLLALDKAGVAPSVIDVMVALSNPTVFALDRTRLGDPPPNVAGEGRERVVYAEEYYDYYDYSRYGYDPYGYGYGSGYGWYSGRRPVVIVERSAADEEHGRVVKGRGYVSGRDEGSRSGTTRSSGESGRAGSSGSSGSSSDKPSSSSTGRKAKPKPPGE